MRKHTPLVRSVWSKLAMTSGLALVVGCAGAAWASLVGYWPLDGDGRSVSGRSGVLVGGPTAAADRNGQPGGALEFNGASQYVNIHAGGGLNGAAQGTISMWVDWTGAQDAACCGGTFGNVLGRQSNGLFSNNILGLGGDNPAAAGVTWQPYGAGGPVISGGTPVGDGVWRHVAVTFSSGSHTLYLDGVSQGTSGAAGTFGNNPSTPLSIGAWIGDGAGFARARIDDLAIWDDIRSPAEIAQLAARTRSPLDFGPVGPDTSPIQGVTARASSEIRAPFARKSGNTVDGLGQATIVPDANPGDVDGMWLSAGVGFGGPNDPKPGITYDLGGTYSVQSLTLYNYNEQAAGLSTRGVREAAILTSANGVDFTSRGTFTFAQAPGDPNSNPGQSVSLGGVQARFVKLDILSNYSGSNYPTIGADFGFVGLSEVEFQGTFVAPAPPLVAGVNAGAPSYFRPDGRLARHLTDGSGLVPDNDLDGIGQHSSSPPGGQMWLTAANPASDERWVRFNLNGLYELDAAQIWNYNEDVAFTLDRQVASAAVQYSIDGIHWNTLKTATLKANAPGSSDYDDVDRVAFNAAKARFVRLGTPADPLGRRGGEGNDENFTGLSEVQFFGKKLAPARLDLFSGVTAAASSEFTPDGRFAADAANGVGLAGDPDGDGVQAHNNVAQDMWLSSAGDSTPWIRFDLGHDRLLGNMLVWNYNEATGTDLSSRGVKRATIKYATARDVVNGLNLADPTDPRWTTLATNVPFTRADQTERYEAVDEFLFGTAAVHARHVVIGVEGNFGDPSFTGLSEVQFFGRTPIRGVTAAASSSLDGSVSGFNRQAANTVDGLGQVTTVPDGNPGESPGMWLSAGNGFVSASDTNPEITFDLGAAYSLDAVQIFNYNENSGNPAFLTGRGVRQAEVLVSLDGFVSDVRSLGIFDLDRATGDGNNPGQLLELHGVIAGYVRLDILSNHHGSVFPGGLSGVDADFVGLNEVEFFGNIVPEPGTFALLALSGLLWVVYVLRRRKA